MTVEELNLVWQKALNQGVLSQSLGVIVSPSSFKAVMASLKQVLDISTFDIWELAPTEKGSIGIKEVKNWLTHLYRSAAGQNKLGVILSADRLTNDAATALLKTLEEPPNNTYLVLLAQREAWLSTISSRLQTFHLIHSHSKEVIELPESKLERIKLGEDWFKNHDPNQVLLDLLKWSRGQLRTGQISAKVVEEVHQAYLAGTKSRNRRLLFESLLLSL